MGGVLSGVAFGSCRKSGGPGPSPLGALGVGDWVDIVDHHPGPLRHLAEVSERVINVLVRHDVCV